MQWLKRMRGNRQCKRTSIKFRLA